MGKSEEAKGLTDVIFPKVRGAQDLFAFESVEAAFQEAVSAWKSLDTFEAKIEPLRHLGYLLPLVRYYKPEFENCSREEQQDLLKKTCDYTIDFLESLRKLQAFLEYGTPNRKLAPATKEPNRDVRAAILHDVNALNYRQIGERMGIPLPPDFEIKGEHQTVRKTVERGHRILEGAFGKEGWRERAEAMKNQNEWWQSLSEEEQFNEWEVESTALTLGISIEEARRRVEGQHS